MTDNKQINHIYISGTNAYLSLPFGIIKLDTKKEKYSIHTSWALMLTIVI